MFPQSSSQTSPDRVEAGADDLAYQGWLADLGELAGPLVHEFNNFLNTVLLQVTVVEYGASGDPRDDLVEIRRQGKAMAALINRWQQSRRPGLPAPRPVDLNSALRAAVAVLEPSQAARVQLHLTPDVPAVLGRAADLRRLCAFLVNNALAAGAPVTVRTELGANGVSLRVEDSGGGLAPEMLHTLFEASGPGRTGTNSLELAACQSLMRRFHGSIKGMNRPEGGVIVLVEFPSAPV